MRVLQTKSPELFDGSEDEPVRVTDYNYILSAKPFAKPAVTTLKC